MALIDHVIVLDHLRPQVISGPPTQSFEELLRSLGVSVDTLATLPPAAREQRVSAAGEPKSTAAALDFRPSGLVVEVAWSCGCGRDLHSHHDLVLGVWAAHVAEAEGITAERLLEHVVASIAAPDTYPRVSCLCGQRWESNSFLPGAALAEWERHVRTDT